jgi:hypothetical protein
MEAGLVMSELLPLQPRVKPVAVASWSCMLTKVTLTRPPRSASPGRVAGCACVVRARPGGTLEGTHGLAASATPPRTVGEGGGL